MRRRDLSLRNDNYMGLVITAVGSCFICVMFYDTISPSEIPQWDRQSALDLPAGFHQLTIHPRFSTSQGGLVTQYPYFNRVAAVITYYYVTRDSLIAGHLYYHQ